jgi:GNAT superfamily N-acetyltransferase
MAQADPQTVPAHDAQAVPFAPWEIASIEERRQAQVVRTLGKQARSWAGGVASFDAPGSWINQIINAGSAGEVTVEDVVDIASWYEQRGAEATITITPYAHPSLRASLGEAGFVLRAVESLLVADLQGCTPQPSLPPGCSLHLVDKADPEDVERYAHFASRVHFGEQASETLTDSFRRAVRDPRAINHLLFDRDAIVGACGAECFENLGALWGGAIAPLHRRRGLQRQLIEFRLATLRDLGLRWATIASEPTIGTERNALRAGMRPAYARMKLVRPGKGLVASP